MALPKNICWLKCQNFMRSCHPWWHFNSSAENRKTIALQRKSRLCRFPQPLIHHIGHSRNKLSVGGFAFFGTDGVAEVAVQHLPVASGPGYLHQVPDGPFHPGSSGVENHRQLRIETICWNIYGINVLLFIGLYSL